MSDVVTHKQDKTIIFGQQAPVDLINYPGCEWRWVTDKAVLAEQGIADNEEISNFVQVSIGERKRMKGITIPIATITTLQPFEPKAVLLQCLKGDTAVEQILLNIESLKPKPVARPVRGRVRRHTREGLLRAAAVR